MDWGEGYLFVVDEGGAEIVGSRRQLRGIRTREAYWDLRRQLERQAGEGCMVLDSVVDRAAEA